MQQHAIRNSKIGCSLQIANCILMVFQHKVKGVVFLVGSKIRLLRKDRQLSQGKLAEKAGITKAYLSQIENDKRSASVKTLSHIAKAMAFRLLRYLMKAYSIFRSIAETENRRMTE